MLIPCTQGTSILSMFFYDSPTLPAGIFDDFLAIPQRRSDLGTRGMASMATAGNYSGLISGHRWVIECPPSTLGRPTERRMGGGPKADKFFPFVL